MNQMAWQRWSVCPICDVCFMVFVIFDISVLVLQLRSVFEFMCLLA